MQDNLSTLFLLLASINLSACVGSGAKSSVNSPVTTTSKQTVSSLRISDLGVIPSIAGQYLLQINNFGLSRYSMQSLEVYDAKMNNIRSSAVIVDGSSCNTIPGNGSCLLQITPRYPASGVVQLVVKFRDETNGTLISLKQAIRLNNILSGNGINVQNDLLKVISTDGSYRISLPVLLSETYDEIRATNGRLLCTVTGFNKGNSCTYLVQGKVAASDTIVATRLEGYKSGKLITTVETNIRVTIEKGAHLVLSKGTSINYPEISNEITVSNIGTLAASNFSYRSHNPNLQVLPATINGCTTTLNPGSMCQLKVSLKSELDKNGSSAIEVSYKDNNESYTTGTNVNYTVNQAIAGIRVMESTNNLLNAVVGGKIRFAEVNITNNAGSALSNISYSLTPNNIYFNLKGIGEVPCKILNASLAPGESCRLQISYQPGDEINSLLINLNIKADYTNENGLTERLADYYGLNYSAIEPRLRWTFRGSRMARSHFLLIKADGYDWQSMVFHLANDMVPLGESVMATLKQTSFTKAIPGLRVTPENPEQCSKDFILSEGKWCSYRVTYGPVDKIQEYTLVNLNMQYLMGSFAKQHSTESIAVRAYIPDDDR